MYPSPMPSPGHSPAVAGHPSPAYSFGGPSPAGQGRASPPSMGPPPGPCVPLGRDTLYPPDQPIINTGNPSAPPIYPCGICRKEVHENDQVNLKT